MSGLVALDSGSAAEARTFDKYRDHLAAVAYTGGPVTLDDAEGAWVPEGTPRRRLAALVPALEALLGRGGTVLLFGDHQLGWPSTARWSYRPAGGAGKTVLPGGGFTGALAAAARRLHHHGVLDPPPGTDLLVTAPDGAAVAYLDRVSTPGALFVSTIDPLAHFGHTADAAARCFLDTFLPWATGTLLPAGR